MKRSRIHKIQLIIASVVVLLSSCNIYEDNSDCPMYVTFKYDYNMLYEDLLQSQCERVELFIYNQNGILQHIIDKSQSSNKYDAFKIPLNLSAGTYTLMAWAGRKESYQIKNNIINTSRIEDLILSMNDQDGHSSHELEPLWYGTPITFTIKQAYGHKELIDLHKNTNRITISITDLNQSIDKDDIDVIIKAKNSTYDYNNNTIEGTTIQYHPFENKEIENNKVAYTCDVLRLRNSENTFLSVIDKKTQNSLLPKDSIDMVELLMKTKPAHMSQQEYLDRQDIWNIDLYVKEQYIAVMIQVNEWTVWIQDNEL